MTNRIHIDAPTGVIEVEGEKDFVEAQLDKLMPLITACGFGTRPVAAQAAEQNSETLDEGDASASENGKATPLNGAKKSKRSVNRPPKGHSCADRMMSLRSEGFFKERKTPADIVNGLKSKGFTHTSNQVGAAGTNMHKRGDIQRTKTGDGPWEYYWDRD